MSQGRPANPGDAPVEWESFDSDEGFLDALPQDRPDQPTVQPAASPPVDTSPVQPAQFMPLSDESEPSSTHGIDFLRDVEVEVTAELGSTRMQIKHILGLRPGSVVELNRLAGEPVDIMVNKTLIARGEVVVVDEKFAVRVVQIVPPERRLASS